MEKKNYLILDDEFIQYCKLNNIDDIEKKAKELFTCGFNLEKYGEKPNFTSKPLTEGDTKTNIKDNVGETKIAPVPSPMKINKKDDLYD